MTTCYAAFGLALQSSFQLSGMLPEQASELPSLELTLTTPGELEKSWRDHRASPEWRGRLGDGRELVIERGSGDDRLFSYRDPDVSGDDLASFHLHSSMRRLVCASRSQGLDWQQALIGKVLPAISVMRGYEALHAAAVVSPQGTIAIMAPSGSGKSTLALELLRRGWPLLADDVLALERIAGTVYAHPGSPHMNLSEPLPDALDPQELGTTLGMLGGERWLAARMIAKRARPMRMACLLERAPGLPLESRVLPASPLALAPYILGLSTDAERQRDRFCLYSDLMRSTTLLRLTAGSEHRPAQLADLLELEIASACTRESA
ncbi:MAG TPA: hypothetical protein VGH60_09330 [Solirubrobacteraceae bacterium]